MLTHSTNRCLAKILATTAVLALLLSGCGAGRSSDSESGDARGTVQVIGAYGKVEVPVTDDNVWALDPTAAVELLTLGVVPTHTGRYTYKGDAAYRARERILTDAGVKLVEPDKLELILQRQPDLIVGFESPSTDELIDELQKIAPVVIADGTAPWDESLGTLGKVTGNQDKAQAIVDHLHAELAETRKQIQHAGYAGETVSVISSCGAGTYCVYDSGRTAGALLTSLGFKRPVGQNRAGKDGFTTISEEKLGDLVAPIVIVLTGSVQFGGTSPLEKPNFDTSKSVTGTVDFSAWYGAGSFDVPWILNDIRAVLLDEGSVARAKDGVRFYEGLEDAATDASTTGP